MKKIRSYGLKLIKCDECGKEFIPAARHLYKKHKGEGNTKKVTIQCSYNCYRKAGGDRGYI